MDLKSRQEEVLSILSVQGYSTVKYLVETLHYSSATINRDLNELQKRGLVRRTHGGVEILSNNYVPIFFRSHLMQSEKRQIGKLASTFVKDGDTIFIDASTTAQSMEQFLFNKKNVTVVTNNMSLAINLSQAGIKTICLGGEVVESPCMLCSAETVANASRYKVDKMFFSTKAVSLDGLIASGIYDLMLKAIARQATEVFYLVDHKKTTLPFNTVYGDFNCVNYVLSDFVFPTSTINAYKNTTFVNTENL